MLCSVRVLFPDPAEIFLLCKRESEVVLDYSNWIEWQNSLIIFV